MKLPHLFLMLAITGLFLTSCANSGSGLTQTGTDPTIPGHPLSNPEQHLHSFAIAPGSNPRIYLGTHYGLFWSSDGGQTWPQKRGILNNLMITSIAINSRDPDMMMIAGLSPSGVNFGQNGVLVSRNAGQTWTLVNSNLPGNPPNVYAVYAGISSSNEFYAFVVGQGVYVTEDAGLNWNLLTRTDNSTAFKTLLVDQQTHNNLFIGLSSGLYELNQGSSSLQKITSVIGEVFAIKVSQVHPNILYCSTDNGFYKSVDGGKTFSLISIGQPLTSFVVNSTDDAILYGISGQEMFSTQDGGQDWKQIFTFTEASPMDLIADPSDPSTLFAGFYFPALAVESNNSGASWRNIAS